MLFRSKCSIFGLFHELIRIAEIPFLPEERRGFVLVQIEHATPERPLPFPPPAVTNSADIAWSHDWGGWLVNSISRSEDDPRHRYVSDGLWSDHLLSLSDTPVYKFIATERAITQYSPSHSLVKDPSLEHFSLS